MVVTWTPEKVRELLRQAHRNGRDGVESLHAVGAILTEQTKKQIVVVTLEDLLRDLEQWTPAQFVRRINRDRAPTAKDMYDAILGYVADYVDSVAAQEAGHHT